MFYKFIILLGSIGHQLVSITLIKGIIIAIIRTRLLQMIIWWVFKGIAFPIEGHPIFINIPKSRVFLIVWMFWYSIRANLLPFDWDDQTLIVAFVQSAMGAWWGHLCFNTSWNYKISAQSFPMLFFSFVIDLVWKIYFFKETNPKTGILQCLASCNLLWGPSND